MNKDCYEAKKQFISAKESLLENTNSFDRRQNFILQERKCKRVLYFTKKAFAKNNLKRLSEQNKKVPKLFWNGAKKLMNDTKKYGQQIYPSITVALKNSLKNFKKLLSPRRFEGKV